MIPVDALKQWTQELCAWRKTGGLVETTNPPCEPWTV